MAPCHAASGLGFKFDSPAAERVAINAMALLGARDLSIGTALAALYLQNKPASMGTVTLSGMILCVIDVAWVFKEGLVLGNPRLGSEHLVLHWRSTLPDTRPLMVGTGLCAWVYTFTSRLH